MTAGGICLIRFEKIIIFSLSLFFLVSCGGSKKTAAFSEAGTSTLPQAVRENALNYLGTRYRYGGTSEKGMDCSGLIYTSFLEEDVYLPRTSRAMSLEGKRIHLGEAQIGDLLFFGTDKNSKVINHVGYITEVSSGEIFFIHSTTSRGVIISALSQDYWHRHFVMARRVFL